MAHTITILDTSIATDNLGDSIIMQAVDRVISEVFPSSYANRVATHDFLGRVGRKLIGNSDLVIAGGTNLLDPRLFGREALWKLVPADCAILHDVILLGVGWRGYTKAMSASSRWALNRILSKKYSSSVRDDYTRQRLQEVDAPVLNTGCITMWGFDAGFQSSISPKKASTVVTTLTAYKPDRNADRRMLETLAARYERVLFWPQQEEDRRYFEDIRPQGIDALQPRLADLDLVLDGEEVDFIGTRLHAGIRSIQKRHRALVIAIDNRAAEISRDTGLASCARGDIKAISDWIEREEPLRITLPQAAIDKWRCQF